MSDIVDDLRKPWAIAENCQHHMARAAGEIERLREVLMGVEIMTATGCGLTPEEAIMVHILAAEGRSDDPLAWRADPAAIERLRAAVRGETIGGAA